MKKEIRPVVEKDGNGIANHHIKVREELNFRSCELLEIVFLFVSILFSIDLFNSQMIL